ncbi:hypothetical protein AURDEDRAFT_165315 [Auricularia subglabra TFB-10046 SS5]|nr:hypothetical protein AURDEDRAFT_165315 [Auricularia subglabra TFB-10046 SS5]
MQDNTILALTHTTSASTLSPISEQGEQLQANAHSPKFELEEHDIVSDEMFYKTPVVESPTTIPDTKAMDRDVEQPPAQVAPPRKTASLLRIVLLGAALVPLWAGWSTFTYFLVLATLWPYPHTPLTESDAAATLALVCGLALPVVTVLLCLWAFSPSGVIAAFKTRHKNRGNCATLWPYVLLFVGATLATLVPVGASYAVLSGGGDCAGPVPVTAYLTAGHGGDGTAVLFDGSERFDSYTLSHTGEGTIAFANGTNVTTYATGSIGIPRKIVVDDEGQAVLRTVAQAPLRAGCRTLKVCVADPRERGELSQSLIAQALWAQIIYAGEHC